MLHGQEGHVCDGRTDGPPLTSAHPSYFLLGGWGGSLVDDIIFRYCNMRDDNRPPAITSSPPEALSPPVIGL